MQAGPHLDVLIVTTTVATAAQAQALAQALLDARLAACVQVDDGLRSVYRWQGQVCEEPELRLTIKTLPAHLAALQAFLDEHHPYDVPQCTAWTAQASPAYAAWLRSEVRPPSAP